MKPFAPNKIATEPTAVGAVPVARRQRFSFLDRPAKMEYHPSMKRARPQNWDSRYF